MVRVQVSVHADFLVLYRVSGKFRILVMYKVMRIYNRARPWVADGGAPYRELLLNTDMKLNKQSLTMFQGWS